MSAFLIEFVLGFLCVFLCLFLQIVESNLCLMCYGYNDGYVNVNLGTHLFLSDNCLASVLGIPVKPV